MRFCIVNKLQGGTDSAGPGNCGEDHCWKRPNFLNQSTFGYLSSSPRENPLSVNMGSFALVLTQFCKETKALPSPAERDPVLECSLGCPRFLHSFRAYPRGFQH